MIPSKERIQKILQHRWFNQTKVAYAEDRADSVDLDQYSLDVEVNALDIADYFKSLTWKAAPLTLELSNCVNELKKSISRASKNYVLMLSITSTGPEDEVDHGTMLLGCIDSKELPIKVHQNYETAAGELTNMFNTWVSFYTIDQLTYKRFNLLQHADGEVDID